MTSACAVGPPRDTVSTADVHRFVDALNRLSPADSTCASFIEYFRNASPGLRAYSNKFDVHAPELCRAVRRTPGRYADIGPKLAGLDSARDRIDTLFAKFRALVPGATMRPVYFVVGNGISGGTTTRGRNSIVLIGVERMGSPERVAKTVAHEFVHTLQDYPWIGMLQAGPAFLKGSVLRNSIMEGSASFLADVVAGDRSRNEWAEAHEAELWRVFQRELHSKDYGHWLYNGRSERPAGWPADLGYFMGYRIVESYYARAADKARAIHEILTISDFDRFLRESGYRGPDSTRAGLPRSADDVKQ